MRGSSLWQVSVGKLLIVLVIVVIFLQSFHIFLLTQLVSHPSTNDISQSVLPAWPEVLSKIQTVHVLDGSGMYLIVKNLLSSDAKTESHGDDVTLVTHTTSDHLGNLVLLSQTWKGPISVSVFTYAEDAEWAVNSVFHLFSCYESIRKDVSFHLIFPLTSFPNLSNIEYKSTPCGKNSFKQSHNFEIEGLDYPHNVLRNMAISASNTNYVFMIDIDLVPSFNLRKSFPSVVKHAMMDKTAFVVPVFETDDNHIPKDKNSLLNDKNVQPFYFDVCAKCQQATDYQQWKNLIFTKELSVGYNIDWKYPWEPFYIAPKNLPKYDEQFKQYGFNRVSQICEMHMAGYQFSILNNAFLVHKGIKKSHSFHKNKAKEHKANKILYTRFKQFMQEKYPNTNRTCG